jgi:catechol 2,3-dioxygenase-like lactoylglutathione lyase family enzyme
MTTPAPTTLGNFSVSLSVKDLAASRTFYEALGFEVVFGEPAHKWVILRNGDAIIGLFEGHFERNMLTFNPGWDRSCHTLPEFPDVREIQQRLQAVGITPIKAVESSTGPGSMLVVDPDGNPILFDQHV